MLYIQFQTIKFFAKNIFNCKITLNNANESQCNLLVEITNLKKKKQKQKPQREKSKKQDPCERLYDNFLMVDKWFLTVVKVKYFYYFQWNLQNIHQI